MLAGGSIVGLVGRRLRRKELLMSFGILAAAVFIVLIAAAANRIVTMGSAVALGAATAFIVIPATALIQSETQQDMRGRVSSSSISLISSSQGLALLFAGEMASRMGIVPVYYASAGMLFAVGIAGLWRLRLTRWAN